MSPGASMLVSIENITVEIRLRYVTRDESAFFPSAEYGNLSAATQRRVKPINKRVKSMKRWNWKLGTREN
jgi:hypothetical protein